MPITLTPGHINRLRRDLARKGMEVNGKLTRLLANMNARLLDLKTPDEQKPGLRPEEKLRRYLDKIIAAQRRLGTEGWGKCVTCQAEIPQAQLDDSPWKAECDRCLADEGALF
ncbi:MAG: hypothetical protein KC502_15260 [Myxococcales bacterium]|nr:hypothetical protein [Myxococcales bacterium]